MLSDEQLLEGDARRFATFYRRHEDAVLGFFLKRVRSAELAADLTAETFARALEGRGRFDAGRGDAGAWLFGPAVVRIAFGPDFALDRQDLALLTAASCIYLLGLTLSLVFSIGAMIGARCSRWCTTTSGSRASMSSATTSRRCGRWPSCPITRHARSAGT